MRQKEPFVRGAAAAASGSSSFRRERVRGLPSPVYALQGRGRPRACQQHVTSGSLLGDGQSCPVRRAL